MYQIMQGLNNFFHKPLWILQAYLVFFLFFTGCIEGKVREGGSTGRGGVENGAVSQNSSN